MRWNHSDYQSYRGRKTLTDWLKWITLVLAILVMAAVLVLLLGRDYLQGLRVEELPQFQQTEQPTEPGPVPVEPQPELGKKPDQPSVPAREVNKTLSLISVPVSALLDQSGADLVQQAGANGVVVEMKDPQGTLVWQSQQPLAQRMDGAEVNQKLIEWNQSGVYTVARLRCFRDENLGKDMERSIRTLSGYRWRDGQGLHWASPASAEARDYLVGLMVELAQMGFDEIVLEDFGYPAAVDGSQTNIRRSDTPEQEVEAFLQQAKQALAAHRVKLSVQLPVEVATGGDGYPGITPKCLEENVDHIWVDGVRSDVLAALEQAGITQTNSRLVSVTHALESDVTTHQAVLS